MSKETGPDPEEAKYLHLSAKTVWVEVARASYALGIGGLVTITLVFGAYVLDIESSREVAATVFSTGFLLPVVLYLYDRHHRRDLVIADFGHLVLRPFSFLYRIFQNP